MTMQYDEQDEIIQELDVYLSLELSSLLYYLQFPTRYEPFPATVSINAKFKPKCQVLELGVPIPTTQNANYCRDKGLAFAASASSKDFKDEHETMLGKQIWSAHVMPNSAHYMMGIIHDGKFFLTPIKATLQLRLNMNYLLADLSPRPAIAASQRFQSKDSKDVKVDEEAPAAKTIQMQFRKRETEEELQSRMKSYTWQQKLVNEEHWLSLQYHDSESEDSRLTFLSIFQKTPHEQMQ